MKKNLGEQNCGGTGNDKAVKADVVLSSMTKIENFTMALGFVAVEPPATIAMMKAPFMTSQ
jgi:hypothetical protein